MAHQNKSSLYLCECYEHVQYQEKQGIMWISFSVTCYIRGNENWIGVRRLRNKFRGIFFLCRSYLSRGFPCVTHITHFKFAIFVNKGFETSPEVIKA